MISIFFGGGGCSLPICKTLTFLYFFFLLALSCKHYITKFLFFAYCKKLFSNSVEIINIYCDCEEICSVKNKLLQLLFIYLSLTLGRFLTNIRYIKIIKLINYCSLKFPCHYIFWLYMQLYNMIYINYGLFLVFSFPEN